MKAAAEGGHWTPATQASKWRAASRVTFGSTRGTADSEALVVRSKLHAWMLHGGVGHSCETLWTFEGKQPIGQLHNSNKMFLLFVVPVLLVISIVLE